MTSEKCAMKDCGATADDEPKRTLFNFPIDDKERCQRWVDACENDEIIKQYKDGVLDKNVGVCGFHFPVAYRASKDLPTDIDPVPYSKCTCLDSTHTQCYPGLKAGYINSEHSYNKKTVNVDKQTECSVHGKNGSSGEKVEKIEKGKENKSQKKVETVVNKKSPTKPVTLKDDHLYFVNPPSEPATDDDHTWSHSAVIHQKEPEKVKRKNHFHVFTDTTVARWTCIPETSRFRYLSRVIKFHNLEADTKVNDLSKAVNKDIEVTFRDIAEEEETEHWALHSSDGRPNVDVKIKSSWLPQQTVRKCTINANAKKLSLLKKKEETENSAPTFPPVLKTYQANHNKSSYQSDQSKVGDNLTRLLHKYTSKINSPAKNKFKYAFETCSTTVKEINGIPVRITGPFKNHHSVFSKRTLDSLGLTPQSQYNNFDFTNSDMSFWHYQCDNGILETIVECKSGSDKSRVVKLPAKQVINQLILANKKFQYLKSNVDKKKDKNKMKCREHIKEIRRLRYKIVQLQKELDAPKPYEKFLNHDQIESMEKESPHGHHWKDDTIVLAHNIRLACTSKGYKYLANTLHWPLPSIKTVRKRAKELHLPCPEAVRTVLVRKPGEGKRNVAIPKRPEVNGLSSEGVDDDSNDESKPKSSSVISINPSSKINSPKLAKVKRKRRTKEEIMRDKLNKGLTVNVDEIANLIYNNGQEQINLNYGQQQFIVQKPKVTEAKTVKKPTVKRKMKIQEVLAPEEEIVIKKAKTIDEEQINNENVCFEETIPEFLDENEVYYKFIKLEGDQDQFEEIQISDVQGDFIYSDQLQTLADASFIHQSPEKFSDKKIIVRNVNSLSPAKNSNQFNRYYFNL